MQAANEEEDRYNKKDSSYHRHGHSNTSKHSKDSQGAFSDQSVHRRKNMPGPSISPKFRKPHRSPSPVNRRDSPALGSENKGKHRVESSESKGKGLAPKRTAQPTTVKSQPPVKHPRLKLQPVDSDSKSRSIKNVDRVTTDTDRMDNEPATSSSGNSKSRLPGPSSALVVSTASLKIPNFSKWTQSQADKPSAETTVSPSKVNKNISGVSNLPITSGISNLPSTSGISNLPSKSGVSSLPSTSGTSKSPVEPVKTQPDTPGVEDQQVTSGAPQRLFQEEEVPISHSENSEPGESMFVYTPVSVAVGFQNGYVQWNLNDIITPGHASTEIDLANLQTLLGHDFDVFEFLAFLRQAAPGSNPTLGSVRVDPNVDINGAVNAFLTNSRLWRLLNSTYTTPRD